MANEYPLSLVIRAVDRATAPLRQINAKLAKITAPVRKLNNAFRALADEAGLPRLAKTIGGLGRAVGRVGGEALALGAKLGAVAAGAAFGFYRIVRGAVDAGDKLAEMADRVGLSVDAYAQLQFAAAQADIEQEAFNGAMDQFNRRLGEAKSGSGPLRAFLEKVAPALGRQVKGAKSTEAALALMISAFEKVEDPGKRAALAAAAFGKSGLQMGVWLHQGGKAIDAQRRRYFDLAGSQEAFARGAGDLDNAIRETETAFLGLRAAATGALFPALTQLASAITGIIGENRQSLAAWARDAGDAISGWVKSGGLERLIVAMREWRGTIASVVDAIGGLKGVLAVLGVYLAADFIVAIGGAVAALWSLGATAIPVAIRGIALMLPWLWKGVVALTALNLANPIFWIAAVGAALVGAGLLVYKYWEPISAFFVGVWETIKRVVNAAGSVIGWKPFDTSAGPGAPAGAASAAAPGTQSVSSHVTVDFNNAPPGTRMRSSHDRGAALDLSMGYSMVGP